jgi:cytochrome c oxidase subunit 5b
MLSAFRAASRALAPSAGAAFRPRTAALPLGTRGYRHWWKVLPEDFELPQESMPDDVTTLMKSNPVDLGFVDSYWYWRIRAETAILDPENLPKKSYKQLARDMGLVVVNQEAEHMMGIIELYEYLKGSPMIGPFGTIENPVLIPSITTERVVGCTGGTGDDEHMILFFRCQEGFLDRCGECDQVFMHVRVVYEHEKLWAAKDPEVSDVFDFKLLEKGHKMWNEGEMALWDVGYKAQDAVLGGRVLPGMQEYRDHIDNVAAGGMGTLTPH